MFLHHLPALIYFSFPSFLLHSSPLVLSFSSSFPFISSFISLPYLLFHFFLTSLFFISLLSSSFLTSFLLPYFFLTYFLLPSSFLLSFFSPFLTYFSFTSFLWLSSSLPFPPPFLRFSPFLIYFFSFPVFPPLSKGGREKKNMRGGKIYVAVLISFNFPLFLFPSLWKRE